MKFGPKDSLTEFCTDITFLMRKAWPDVDDKTRQEMEVEYFIKNLGDPGMIHTVGNQAPDNLEDARQLAETYMRHGGPNETTPKCGKKGNISGATA